jgi:K+-sensing histidine kinase KdpD
MMRGENRQTIAGVRYDPGKSSRDAVDGPILRAIRQSQAADSKAKILAFGLACRPRGAVLGVVTFVGFRRHADPAAAALVDLFVIVLTSLRAGLVAAVVVAIIAILCLDYFFTPPLFRVAIGEIDAVALIVFSTTALVITRLMSSVRKSLEEIQRSEKISREQASLLDLTHDTVFVRDLDDVITYWNLGAEELPAGREKRRSARRVTNCWTRSSPHLSKR